MKFMCFKSKTLFLAAVVFMLLMITDSFQVEAAGKYDTVFDASYYASHNPDVVAAFGNNSQKLLEHFVAFGMREGRQGNASFNVQAYKARYADLQKAFGNDLPRYYEHYISFGAKEGRNGSATGVVQATNTTQNVQAQTTTTTTTKSKKSSRPTGANAVEVLNQIGWDLNAAFNWSAGFTYYGHGAPGMPDDASPGVRWYANYGFTNNKGNCFVMAATFYEMAKALGYQPRQMAGYVPSRKKGLTPHSWVEMDFDGQTYVFDPDYTYGTGKSGFKLQYGQKGTWRYQNYIVMNE
ncbi:transglutaminase domain-containing protein [Butyrivibrio sp. VCB2006]|uniref:transglutaminase domain-containing protein n=1 Tax=Butyrivibrio sp. VCB2006 TaxID=1280679 RepID=UPI000402F193|nr:transglutaminase domain-containing protein [Butyrivibrio sp. VCB2006]